MNCTHETTEFRRQRYEWNGRAWQKVKQCLICGERIPYSDKNPFYPEDFDNEIINLPAYDYRFLHKNDGKEIVAEDFKLRNSCKVCNNTTGFVTKANMQHVAYCDNCGAYAYSPSKADLGMKNNNEMVKFSYRCKCGAMVHGWAAHEVTTEEMETLQKRDCDSATQLDDGINKRLLDFVAGFKMGGRK